MSRWLVALTLVGVLGCDHAEPTASAAPSAAPPVTSVAKQTPLPDASRPDVGATRNHPLNVVLILIDSMRWDMPWNGYPRPIAPLLTGYEKTVVSYTRAYSISCTTARSVAPLMVGKYPSEMPRNGYFFTQYMPENLFLGERLRAAGRRALGVAAHAYFFPASGLAQGFDELFVLPGTVMNNPDEKNVTGERLTEAAKRILSRKVNVDQSDGKRFFAYLHYMDPHAPYVAYEDQPLWGHQPRDRYDQEIHYTDAQVAAFVRWAKRQPWGPDTAFIVSADHGESFGEHGHLKHGYEVWEELVRVPLFIDVPGGQARRIDVPRSHIDLAPTILELMGVAAKPPLRGTSLVPEVFGADPEPRPVVVDLTRDNLENRRRALIEGTDKLIATGDDEKWLLFDVVADPREKKDLTADRPRFKRMRERYFEVSKTIPLVEVRGDEPPLKDAPEGRRW